MPKSTTFYFNVAVTVMNATLMEEAREAQADGFMPSTKLIAESIFETQISSGQAEIEIIECTEMVESEEPYQPEL